MPHCAFLQKEESSVIKFKFMYNTEGTTSTVLSKSSSREKPQPKKRHITSQGDFVFQNLFFSNSQLFLNVFIYQHLSERYVPNKQTDLIKKSTRQILACNVAYHFTSKNVFTHLNLKLKLKNPHILQIYLQINLI